MKSDDFMSTASQELKITTPISPPSPTKGDPSPVLSALADALAGALGSIVAVLAFYPIDIAKTRAQARVTRDSSSPISTCGRRKNSAKITQRSRPSTSQISDRDASGGLEKRGWWFRSRTLAALLSIVKEENGGLYKLYEGVDAKSLQTLVGSFVYFYAYAFIKGIMRQRTGTAGTDAKKSLPPSLNLLAAAMAGAVNQAFTLPLENITTKMQVQTMAVNDPQMHHGRARGDVCPSPAATGVPAAVGMNGADTGRETGNTRASVAGLEKRNVADFCDRSKGAFKRDMDRGAATNCCNIGDGKEACDGVSDTTASAQSGLKTLSLGEMGRFAGTVRQEGRNGVRPLPHSDRGLDADRPMVMPPDAIAHDRGAALLCTASQSEHVRRPNEHQKDPPPPRRGQRPRKSLVTVALNLYREGSGIARFWRGFAPSLVLTCNPAINYTAFDLLKALWLKRAAMGGTGTASGGGFLNPLEAFVIAAAAKCLATLVTYPLIRAKVILMTSAPSSSSASAGSAAAQIDEKGVLLNERTSTDNGKPGRHRAATDGGEIRDRNQDGIASEGLVDVGEPLAVSSTRGPCREAGSEYLMGGIGAILVDILRQEGIGGLYAGCGAQLLHTILKSALLLATKEQIARAAASAVFFGGKGTP